MPPHLEDLLHEEKQIRGIGLESQPGRASVNADEGHTMNMERKENEAPYRSKVRPGSHATRLCFLEEVA